jgi:hypothetical protein
VTRRIDPRIGLVAGVVLLLALTWANMDLLADSFWYVAVGRLALDGGRLPTTDPFTFASVPAQVHDAWIVHMPGSVVLFAWLERHFGLRALLVLGTVVECAAVALAWLEGGRGSVAARALTLPLALFAVWMQRDDLCARGQVFADLAWVVTLVLVHRAPDARKLALAGFVLGAAWVNLHSSFAIAVAVPLALALERPRLAALAAGAACGALVNPYGPRLLADVARLAADPTTSQVDLFRSPDFHRADVLFAIVVALVLAPWVARRGKLEGLLLALAALAACWARRNLFILVSVELVLAGDAIAGALRTPALAALLARVPPVVGPAIALAALAVAAPLLATHKDPLAQVPAGALANAERAKVPERVLVEYHWGGYADYAWEGRRKTLVDGRSWIFLNGVYQDEEAIRRLDPEWRRLLDVYEVRTVVWDAHEPLVAELSRTPGWSCRQGDRLAAVCVR